MAAPDDVKDALDRLAAEVSRLRQIVDASHPDFFDFDEWQQDPQARPAPWFFEPKFIPESGSTQDLTEPYDDWQQLPDIEPPPWLRQEPAVIRSQSTSDLA